MDIDKKPGMTALVKASRNLTEQKMPGKCNA
jgi:hypothetical protein